MKQFKQEKLNVENENYFGKSATWIERLSLLSITLSLSLACSIKNLIFRLFIAEENVPNLKCIPIQSNRFIFHTHMKSGKNRCRRCGLYVARHTLFCDLSSNRVTFRPVMQVNYFWLFGVRTSDHLISFRWFGCFIVEMPFSKKNR